MILNMNLLVILLLTWTGLGMTFLYRRDIRFTKIHGHFHNDSVGEVIDFSVRNYHGKHFINLQANVKMPIPLDSISIELIRCKDLYIDCVNYHSYTIKNFCNAKEFYTKMVLNDQPIPEFFKCPLQGYIEMQNMTLNAEKVMSMLGSTLQEPWWDSCWIFRTAIQNFDKRPMFFFELKYYFISSLVYKRNTKKKN